MDDTHSNNNVSVIINGEERFVKNLLVAESLYIKHRDTDKVAIVYRSMIYRANYTLIGNYK